MPYVVSDGGERGGPVRAYGPALFAPDGASINSNVDVFHYTQGTAGGV
jgi:hypothetical protein